MATRRRRDDWAAPEGSAARSAQIVDLTAAVGYKPELGRVTITRSAGEPTPPPPRRRSAAAVARAKMIERDMFEPGRGGIFDDTLDGRRVYPEPPPRTRNIDVGRRLAERFSRLMIPFAVLAAVRAFGLVVDAWSAGLLNPLVLVLLAVRIGLTCGLCLLPAGVLAWRRNAWRSAPLVFAGAALWASLPALGDTATWLVQRAPAWLNRYGSDVDLLAAGISVVSALGAVVLAFGLQRARRDRDSWFAAAAQRGAAVAGLFVFFEIARNTSRWHADGGVPTVPVPADPVSMATAVSGVVEPIAILGLSLIAVTALAGYANGELRGRFWQCLAAGASVLVAVDLNDLAASDNIGSLVLGASGLVVRDPGQLLGAALCAAGVVLVLAGFTSPIWSRQPDAERSALGAPEDIFVWGSAARYASGVRPIPMSSIVAVAAGADHALALDMFGRVAAWGDDSLGQTGVPPDLTDVAAVAAGDGFSVALRRDGSVVAWGANDEGQCSIPDGLRGVRAIDAGRGFVLALRDDGRVVGWGESPAGVTTVPEHLDRVAAIAAGRDHALALCEDGTVVAWGDNSRGQCRVPWGLGPVRAISAGGNFSLALRFDGTVRAWGDGSYGQLDVPEVGDVVAVSAGAFHAVALRASGDVVAWGGGGQTQGEFAHPWRLVDFRAVAAGEGFTLAVRAA